jgi:predicted Zn-dependent protease
MSVSRQALRTLLSTSLALVLIGCATNPVTGKRDVVTTSQKGEIEQGRKAHEDVIKFFGVYEDQALQDYVNQIGQNLARHSERPDLEWHFTVVDADDINAFALPGGYIYLTRGIMAYLNSEAELAAVLGHEIGHVTARHSVRQQSQGLLAGVLATGAAILTGNQAVADLAGIGSQAVLRGYGRDMELEADRLGAQYLAKTGYDPQAIIDVVTVLKNQEVFEIDQARAEGREPRVYHGVFSTHPSADTRLQQAVKVAGKPMTDGGVGRLGKDEYFQRIDGMSFNGSKAQGIVKDNRFYHADMGITVAFPSDWIVLNERNRLLSHTRGQDSFVQLTVADRKEGVSPRDYLTQELRRLKLSNGEEMSFDGMEGYTAIAASGSPLDNGAGPVRYAALYRGNKIYVFAGASRSSQNGVPAADRIFLSTVQTLRGLRPAEFPLTEPNRIHVIKADTATRMAQVARGVPIPKHPEQTIRLMNNLYPNKEPTPGQYIKTVR